MQLIQLNSRKKMKGFPNSTVQISGPDLMWYPIMHCQQHSLDDLKKISSTSYCVIDKPQTHIETNQTPLEMVPQGSVITQVPSSRFNWLLNWAQPTLGKRWTSLSLSKLFSVLYLSFNTVIIQYPPKQTNIKTHTETHCGSSVILCLLNKQTRRKEAL